MSETIIETTDVELTKQMSDLASKVRQDTIAEIKSLNPFGNNTQKAIQKNVGSDLFKSLVLMSMSKKMNKSYEQIAKETGNESYKDVAEILGKTTTFAGGESAVPVAFSNEIIPQLYNASAFLGKIPSRVMTTDQERISKEEWTATVYWGDEIDTTSVLTNASFGDVNLSVKNATATTAIPNNKLKSAMLNGVDLDTTIINSLIKATASAAEYQILYGSGSVNTPLGIDNRMLATNKFNSAGTTVANVEADIYKALNCIENANIPAEMLQLLMSSRTKNYVLAATNSLSMPAFMESRNPTNPTLLGMPFGVTNTIPNNTGDGSVQSHIWLIDWSKFILGMFQDLQVTVDSTGAYRDSAGTLQSALDNDVTVFRARMKFDFGMFYNQAAAKIEKVAYVL